MLSLQRLTLAMQMKNRSSMIVAGVKTRLCCVSLGWHGFRRRTLVVKSTSKSLEDSSVTPLDVQGLFLEKLGISIDDEMSDYVLRRFKAGGAAAVPVAHISVGSGEPLSAPVRRFVELTEALGDGMAVPADATDPLVH
jgi:hypothetical protein